MENQVPTSRRNPRNHRNPRSHRNPRNSRNPRKKRGATQFCSWFVPWVLGLQYGCIVKYYLFIYLFVILDTACTAAPRHSGTMVSTHIFPLFRYLFFGTHMQPSFLFLTLRKNIESPFISREVVVGSSRSAGQGP
jgi:hypothetical protein